MSEGNSIKRWIVALVVLFALGLSPLTPRLAAADVSDFTITDFTADYYLTGADPQGEMRVVEKISVDFTDQNHGILRAIPESYKNHPLNVHISSITSSSGAPSQYSTYGQNGNKVLKIGDPNRTVTGKQEYTIDYTMQNVISFQKDHDELYWDINGDQWNQPFTAVRAVVHLPANLRLTAQPPQCFAGGYGAVDHNCLIIADANSVTATSSFLAPSQTLTVVVAFQKGYFHPMTWRDYLHDYLPDILQFTIPLVLLGGAGFIWWFKRGRDAKGTGVIIPQYDAPDGLKPIEVGAVVDFSVDNRDLTATIIDLAIRKYLRIIENDKKELLVKKVKAFSLQLLNEDWSGLNEWEQDIMAGLFTRGDGRDTIDLAKMSKKLYLVAIGVKKSVERSLTDRGYFVSNPTKFLGASLVSIIVIAVFIAASFHGIPVWLIVGGALGLVVLGIFYHLMPARTAKGVAANEHILGLRMYLEVAEKDRIAKLQSPDAPYAPKTDAPARTVELFEKLLPYAIVLKVEKQWAKKFDDIYKSQPDWYAGNYTAFSAGYLVGSIGGSFAPAVGTSFASPSSSSGSGFGGGGFSGGGGGGGGGGGW